MPKWVSITARDRGHVCLSLQDGVESHIYMQIED